VGGKTAVAFTALGEKKKIKTCRESASKGKKKKGGDRRADLRRKRGGDTAALSNRKKNVLPIRFVSGEEEIDGVSRYRGEGEKGDGTYQSCLRWKGGKRRATARFSGRREKGVCRQVRASPLWSSGGGEGGLMGKRGYLEEGRRVGLSVRRFRTIPLGRGENEFVATL